ncbi:hypothetical protein GX586_00745 [bacterium]|nr:hypothetical protein [bacterium]
MKRYQLMAAVCALAFSAAMGAYAEAISYEPVDYPVTNGAAGLNGGKGWDGAWYQQVAGADAWTVVSPGLTYNDGTENLAVRGGTFKSSGLRATGGEVKRKPLVTPNVAHMITNGSFFGLQGTTNWFSFLTRIDGQLVNVTGTTTNYLGSQAIELNKAPNATMDNFERAMMGARPSIASYGRMLSNRWIIGGFGGAVPDNGTYTGTVEIIPGQTVFYVGRLIYGAPSPTNILATMWINPALSNEPGESAGATPPAWNMLWQFQSNPAELREWNALALVGSVGATFTNLSHGYIDEIRFGEMFRDVAPRDYEVSPVQKPVNIQPANGAVDVTLPVALQASAFASDPGDVHKASRFSIRSRDGVTTTITTNGLTSISVNSGTLRASTKYTWFVQYQGTNSPVWSDPSDETGFTTAPDGSPTLLAYDGCAYAETPFPADIHGGAGGSGWLAAWEGAFVAAGFMRVESSGPGLFYKFGATPDYLSSTGNRFLTSQHGKDWESGLEDRILTSSRATRRLGTDGGMYLLTPSNTYGKSGTTNWLSFLARYEVGDTTLRYGLDLNSGYQGSTPFDFSIGKAAAMENWALIGRGGTPVATSSVSAVNGQAAFLVARVIFAEGNETAHLWVNPATRTEPQMADATVLNGVPHFEYDYMSVTAVGAVEAPNVGIDEVRMGDSWQAVMPLGPPPPVPVGTPTNVAPASGSTDVPLTVTLEATPFVGSSGVDTHLWTEVSFRTLDGAQTNVMFGPVTSMPVPAGVLQGSTRYFWRVRYKGTQLAAPSDWSAETPFDTVYATTPKLICYDGAAINVTSNLNGQGSGSGWRARWQQIWWNLSAVDYFETRTHVDSGSLMYSEPFLTTGNRFATDPAGEYSGTTASTPYSIARRDMGRDGFLHLIDLTTTSTNYGRIGTTNWFSFLARYDSGDTSGRYGIELTDAPGNSSTLANQWSLLIGKPAGTNMWGVAANGGSSAATAVNATDGSTALIVARVAFGAGGASAHVWANPVLGAGEPAGGVELGGIAAFQYNRLGIVAAGNPAPIVSIDEIRAGESFEVVTPIPEPAVLMLVAGAAALMMRRK